MQAAAGFTELSIGSALTFSTYGLAAPLGCALIAHGADHLTAGMRTAITGTYNETATSQLLQKTGMSEQNASFVDSSISMMATIGGTAALKTVQAAAPLPSMKETRSLVSGSFQISSNAKVASGAESINAVWP